MNTLETDFERRVRSAVEECKSLGYYPRNFEDMLQASGAVRVAENLVTSGTIQSGLKRLQSMGRIDLAIESIMLEPRFQPLFRSLTLDAARWHLTIATSV